MVNLRKVVVHIQKFKKTVYTRCQCETPNLVTGVTCRDGLELIMSDKLLSAKEVQPGTSRLYCDNCKCPALTIRTKEEVRVVMDNLKDGKTPFIHEG